MRKVYIALLAGVVVLSSFAAPSVVQKLHSKAKSYLLQYNPKVGTSGTMVMDYTMVVSMEMMGNSMELDQKLEMAAGVEVLENSGNEVVINLAYDYFAMSMSNPAVGDLSYDTRKDDNSGMLATQLDGAFKEIIGANVKITQDKTGKTIKSEGLEKVMGINQNQGSIDFSSVLGMSQFPDKEVEIGESWSHVMDDASSPMRIDATLTLKKIANGKVTIAYKSNVTSNDKFNMEDALKDVDTEGEGTPELGVTGTQTGTFIYEQNTMWLVEGLLTQDLNMTVEQMGMKIPMAINGNMILTME